MTTQEAIVEICSQSEVNKFYTGRNYAVFKPQSITDGVDWLMVAIFFNTNEIHGYGMLDKIVIDI